MKALLLTVLLPLGGAGLAQNTQPIAADNSKAQAAFLLRSSDTTTVADSYCLTMRVYRFERQDGIDREAAQTTCTPAQHFRAAYIPAVPLHRLDQADLKEPKPEKTTPPQR